MRWVTAFSGEPRQGPSAFIGAALAPARCASQTIIWSSAFCGHEMRPKERRPVQRLASYPYRMRWKSSDHDADDAELRPRERRLPRFKPKWKDGKKTRIRSPPRVSGRTPVPPPPASPSASVLPTSANQPPGTKSSSMVPSRPAPPSAPRSSSSAAPRVLKQQRASSFAGHHAGRTTRADPRPPHARNMDQQRARPEHRHSWPGRSSAPEAQSGDEHTSTSSNVAPQKREETLKRIPNTQSSPVVSAGVASAPSTNTPRGQGSTKTSSSTNRRSTSKSGNGQFRQRSRAQGPPRFSGEPQNLSLRMRRVLQGLNFGDDCFQEAEVVDDSDGVGEVSYANCLGAAGTDRSGQLVDPCPTSLTDGNSMSERP